MISEISLLIIAICMVLLLIFVLVLIVVLIKVVSNIGRTVSSLETKASPLLDEAKNTLSNVTDITLSVKQKINDATPLFNSIAKIGAVTEGFLSKAPNQSSFFKIFSHSEQERSTSTLDDWVEWASIGLLLWQKIKARMEK